MSNTSWAIDLPLKKYFNSNSINRIFNIYAIPKRLLILLSMMRGMLVTQVLELSKENYISSYCNRGVKFVQLTNSLCGMGEKIDYIVRILIFICQNRCRIPPICFIIQHECLLANAYLWALMHIKRMNHTPNFRFVLSFSISIFFSVLYMHYVSLYINTDFSHLNPMKVISF